MHGFNPLALHYQPNAAALPTSLIEVANPMAAPVDKIFLANLAPSESHRMQHEKFGTGEEGVLEAMDSPTPDRSLTPEMVFLSFLDLPADTMMLTSLVFHIA